MVLFKQIMGKAGITTHHIYLLYMFWDDAHCGRSYYQSYVVCRYQELDQSFIMPETLYFIQAESGQSYFSGLDAGDPESQRHFYPAKRFCHLNCLCGISCFL